MASDSVVQRVPIEASLVSPPPKGELSTPVGDLLITVPGMAQMQLGSFLSQAVFQTVRIITAAGAVTALSTDNFIIINKTVAAATTVTLISAPATGQRVTIKDGAGNAANYNITISPASGLIDGAATFVINNNYESTNLVYNGANWSVF